VQIITCVNGEKGFHISLPLAAFHSSMKLKKLHDVRMAHRRWWCTRQTTLYRCILRFITPRM